MDKDRIKQQLEPEQKAWIRWIDAFVVLIGTLAMVVVFFVLPLKIEARLLQYSFIGGLVCTPVIAYMMYRATNISWLERISILGLILVAVIALMIAAIESSNNLWLS